MTDGKRRRSRPRRRSGAWSTYDVVRVTAIVITVYALAHLLWTTRLLVLVVFLGVLFGLAVSAGADRLERLGLTRRLGAPLIVFSFLVLLGGFGAWVGPTIREQTVELRTRLPEALDRVEDWVERRGGRFLTALGLDARPREEPVAVADTTPPPAPDEVDAPPRLEPLPREEDIGEPDGSLRERVMEQLGGLTRYLLPVITSTMAVFAAIVLVLFLSIYVAVNPDIYRRGAMFLVPARQRDRVGNVLDKVTATLKRWLVTQLIAMVLVGVSVTIVLFALRVRAAVPLGIIAALTEFIPNIGPILGAVPAVGMGLIDSPQKALAVVIAYIAIQFLESNLLMPLLMQEALRLPPALTLTVQALMTIAFGFMGLLLAVPILAVVVVTIREWQAHAEPPSG